MPLSPVSSTDDLSRRSTPKPRRDALGNLPVPPNPPPRFALTPAPTPGAGDSALLTATSSRRRYARTSGLYLIRCGSSASAPRVSFTHSAYSAHVPSNHVTWLSPSKARMCVATRSRNQRSWLITTAQPAKSSSASSSARRVSTSRSFVGSSSSSTLPPERSSFARWTRLRSPPESWPTGFCWSPPLKLNQLVYCREFTSRLPSSIVSSLPLISFHTVLFGSSDAR